ncbi:MAG: hypothetical protein KAT70_08765 [Thermoplasmata archaeon]|nr:hypothetical protein [Thermoplasmata archaeon]
MKSISYTAAMVKKVLADEKDHTCRIDNRLGGIGEVNQCPGGWELLHYQPGGAAEFCEAGNPRRRLQAKCPWGQPGERLYMKETWRITEWDKDKIMVQFKADGMERIFEGPKGQGAKLDVELGDPRKNPHRSRSPRFMPQWASRTRLTIVSNKPFRIQDISDQLIQQEGCRTRPEFIRLFDSIYAKRFPWFINPWVWGILFAVYGEMRGIEV